MERFQVEVLTFPGDEIPFIKSVRTIGRISLAQASALHTHAKNAQHTVLVAGVERDVADHIAATLQAAGTDTVVKPSSIRTPMVCFPAVNTAYQWGGIRRMVAVPTSGGHSK
jgi:hypothetical protein